MLLFLGIRLMTSLFGVAIFIRMYSFLARGIILPVLD